MTKNVKEWIYELGNSACDMARWNLIINAIQQQARDEALEEAALLCDEKSKECRGSYNGEDMAQRDAYEFAASDIRNLKKETM